MKSQRILLCATLLVLFLSPGPRSQDLTSPSSSPRLPADGASLATLKVQTNLVASEHSGVAVVMLHRSGDRSQPASVHYATENGTALANVDYVPVSGTVEFAPSESENTVSVTILDDGLPGAETYFSVKLSGPSPGMTIEASLSTATITIADSQRPGSIDFTFQPIIETVDQNTSPGLLSVVGHRIALQPDGKVIVAGNFRRVSGVSRNGICRLNSDGSLDPSFDPKEALLPGPVVYGNSPEIAIYSLALQPDGKVLLRGDFDSAYGSTYTNFIRLNTDGSLDSGFAPDKAAQTLSPIGRGAAMAVQPDGKILVAEGDCCASEPAQLARLLADGSADPTFSILAVVGTDGGWGSTFRCIVIDGDGRALFEGNTDSTDPYVIGPEKGLTRLNSDDNVDKDFHPIMDRLALVDWGSRTAAMLQPDGKIVTAGLFTQVNGVERPGLARLNRDGSLDPSFAPGPKENGYHVGALALQQDRKILAGLGDGSLLRLNADGSPDATFEFHNMQEKDVWISFSDIILQPDGQILVALVTDDLRVKDGRVRSTVMRLNGDRFLAEHRARFRSLTRAETGNVQMHLNVVPGSAYAIEASTDLVHWTTLDTPKATAYLLSVTDSAADIPHRFYRALQAPPP